MKEEERAMNGSGEKESEKSEGASLNEEISVFHECLSENGETWSFCR